MGNLWLPWYLDIWWGSERIMSLFWYKNGPVFHMGKSEPRGWILPMMTMDDMLWLRACPELYKLKTAFRSLIFKFEATRWKLSSSPHWENTFVQSPNFWSTIFVCTQPSCPRFWLMQQPTDLVVYQPRRDITPLLAQSAAKEQTYGQTHSSAVTSRLEQVYVWVYVWGAVTSLLIVCIKAR